MTKSAEQMCQAAWSCKIKILWFYNIYLFFGILKIHLLLIVALCDMNDFITIVTKSWAKDAGLTDLIF